MNFGRLGAIALVVGSMTACAATSDRIGASYVSPLVYAGYSCAQIAAERERVTTRVHQAAAAQNRQARNDQIATGIGAVLFWPALFALVGPDRREELSNLKGHYDALEQASIEKRCAVSSPAPVDKKPKSAA